MGEIADAMLDGQLCEMCGVPFCESGECEEMGIPMYCSEECAKDRNADKSQVCNH